MVAVTPDTATGLVFGVGCEASRTCLLQEVASTTRIRTGGASRFMQAFQTLTGHLPQYLFPQPFPPATRAPNVPSSRPLSATYLSRSSPSAPAAFCSETR